MLSPLRSLFRRFDRRQAGRSAVSIGMLAVLWSASLTVVGGLQPAGAQFGSLDFQQCANDDPTFGECHWINGNLNQNNSSWFEGMSVPQRILVTGVEESTLDAHSIDFSTQATKSDAHGYDFLTSYAQASTAHEDFFGIPLTLDQCGSDFTSTSLETTCAGIAPPSPNCVDVNVPDEEYLSEIPAPGTSTLARIQAFEDVYGDRFITLCGDAPITGAAIDVIFGEPANSDGGGNGMTISYHLSWTSESETILIQYATHLAVGVGLAGWGEGVGASEIPGASNDTRLDTFDGSGVAAMTNSIHQNAIATSVSEINITKVVQGGTGSDFGFSFDAPGDLSDTTFTLDDLETVGFAPLSPGVYAVTETDPDPGDLDFDFVGIECTSGADVVINDDPDVRSVTITLRPNEIVNCTFTNAVPITNGGPPAEINVTKIVDSEDGGIVDSEDGGQSFSFTINPPGPDNTDPFALLDGETDTFTAPPLSLGEYVITELGEDGFELVSIECSQGTVDVAAGTATFDLDEDDVVNCTYTNAAIPAPPVTGEILITKEAELADGVLFDFTFDPPGADNTIPFELEAGNSEDFVDLPPGDYVVTELDPVGFDLVSIICDGVALTDLAAGTATIALDAGESIECVYTKRPTPPPPGTGRIIVAKVADEYDTDTEFPFASDFDGVPADGVDFTLEAGEQLPFDLPPGTYAVSELVPPGWDLVSAVCSNGDPLGAIELAEGDVITCTFTNEREADEDYDQYPGDNDFDFDTPFDDAGDPAPQTPTNVGGGNAGVTQTGGQPSGDQLSSAGETASGAPAGPADGSPASLGELPRTGASIRHLAAMAGILLMIGGMATSASPRRRKAYQA